MATKNPKPNHPRFQDLTDLKVGRLRVLEYLGGKPARWLCLCDCGATTKVIGQRLRKRWTKSCGCLQKDKARQQLTKHGLYGTTEYVSWNGMIYRCTNQKGSNYDGYGGRGIKVCQRWQRSFENFIQDMGPKPSPRHSLDRIDNDGDYTPENCRWATPETQANNSRNNRWLSHDNRTLTLRQWSRVTGIKETTLLQRLRRGWNVERAITEPIHHTPRWHGP